MGRGRGGWGAALVGERSAARLLSMRTPGIKSCLGLSAPV